ncbi:MAG: hypothetical protein IPF54_21565 [Draconibacterium sp.]|nr:hypothetical protein [Draconibacterium sp.]
MAKHSIKPGVINIPLPQLSSERSLTRILLNASMPQLKEKQHRVHESWHGNNRNPNTTNGTKITTDMDPI